MSAFTIRRATIDDLDTLMDIEELSFTIPWSRESFAYELLNPRAIYFVLTAEDDEPVAYCGARYVLDEAEILNIAVRPERKRTGGGHLLMQTMIAALGQLGVRRLTLEVREENEPALALYRKNGFRDCGRIRGYYTDTGEDAIIMEHKLP